MHSIVALDIETTGLDPMQDTILELGVVRFKRHQIENRWSTLVNPGRPVPKHITHLTGITDSMVSSAPQFSTVVDKLAAFVQDSPILGHNVEFDLKFLRQHGLLLNNRAVDTYELAATLLPNAQRYNLGALGRLLNIPLPNSHRALDDAYLTYMLFVRLYELAMALPTHLLAEIVRLAKPVDWRARWVFEQILNEKILEFGEEPRPWDCLHLPLFAKSTEYPQEPHNLLFPDIPIDANKYSSHLPGAWSERADIEPQSNTNEAEMAREVASALSNGYHLLIEASSSMNRHAAYLLPAALWAIRSNRCVVIATATATTRKNLLETEIPRLNQILNFSLKTAMLANPIQYLCLRRFENLRLQPPDSPESVRVLAKILVWLQTTQTGNSEELNLNGSAERAIWNQVSAADDFCTETDCFTFMNGRCPLYRAHLAARQAHLLLIDHHFLATEMLTANHALPNATHLIIDDAHSLEHTLTDALKIQFTQETLQSIAKEIGNFQVGALGRLVLTLPSDERSEGPTAIKALARQATEHTMHFLCSTEQFFTTLSSFVRSQHQDNFSELQIKKLLVSILSSTRTMPAWLDVSSTWGGLYHDANNLIDTLKQLILRVGGQTGDLQLGKVVNELASIGARLRRAIDTLHEFVTLPLPNRVYWIEGQLEGRNARLQAAPIQVGSWILEHIWNLKSSVTLTSTTLTVDGNLDYVRHWSSATHLREIILPPSADYERQVLLYLLNNTPEPKMQNRYQSVIEQGLVDFCKVVCGRVLVHFTTHTHLQETSRSIARVLNKIGIQVFMPGGEDSREKLVDQFRKARKAILMDSYQYWDELALSEDTISALVMVKLPFHPGQDPVATARMKTFSDPFVDYTLTEAIIHLRHVICRFLSAGPKPKVIVIFDSRIVTKPYGQRFLDSLSFCTLQTGTMENLPTAAIRWLRSQN